MSVDSSSDVAPLVPEDARADPWTLTETGTETVATLDTARVEGFTVVYEDRRLREAMRERTRVDRPWRFFFATELSFVPTLPVGTDALLEPAVTDAVRQSFADDLRERGLTGVERTGTDNVRVDSGRRAGASAYRGRYEVDGERYDVGGFVAVWYDDGFLVAGGLYPQGGEDAYRDELLDLVRGVSSGRT